MSSTTNQIEYTAHLETTGYIKPELNYYYKILEIQPNFERRIDSGIDGEKYGVYCVEEAGLEIIKVNHLDNPSEYCNDYITDIVARQKIYNHQTGQIEYMYHIFEVTNFKKSTHMNIKIMNEKIDNLLEAARQYPNAKLWLITSYNQFDKYIQARLHRLGINIVTMGRVCRVWGNKLRTTLEDGVSFTLVTNHIKYLRDIIKGKPTKQQQETHEKAERLKTQLGKHTPRKYNVIQQYAQLYENQLENQRLLNQIYKLKTEINKLGYGHTIDKIGQMIKNKIPLTSIKYRLTNKLNGIKDKIEKQRNNGNSVCVKAVVSKIHWCFRKSIVCGLTVDDKVTYFCRYKGYSAELDLTHVPVELHEIVKDYV